MFALAREEIGRSQQELANAAQVSIRTIRAIETDGPCKISTRARVIRALNEFRRIEGENPLRVATQEGRIFLLAQPASWLKFPEREWLKGMHGPGALLTAEFRVVPFHGAESQGELKRLADWCHAPEKLGIRIYKGDGGAGKTRLAVELCHLLAARKEQAWTSGFLDLEDFPEKSSPWDSLPDLDRPVLAVVDYAGAEDKTRPILQLLRHLGGCLAPKLRLLFLERDDLWLGRLHKDKEARQILLGPLLSRLNEKEVQAIAPVAKSDLNRTVKGTGQGGVAFELPPVAKSYSNRINSFQTAIKAFAAKLDLKSTLTSDAQLSGELFDRVLFIHTQALLAFYKETGRGKQAILRHLYAREVEYWEKRLQALGLSAVLLPAIEAAVKDISLNNGAKDGAEAAEILRKVELLQDQPPVVLHQVLTLLRECYPQGKSGVGPLQPDELKNYLFSRFA